MRRLPAGIVSLIVLIPIGCAAQTGAPPSGVAEPRIPARYLRFNGATSYAEVPRALEFSVSATGLTVAVWMRPDTLTFPKTEGSLPTEQYVHWVGKGEPGQQEWTFRMYSQTTPAGPRANRISFYVFNLVGGRGCGSYFQDPIEPGQWIHVVGVVDQAAQDTAIYKNGVLRHRNSFGGTVTPTPGSAPLRFGTKDFASFFEGAIGAIRVWSRALPAREIQDLYLSNVVDPQGLIAQYLVIEGAGLVMRDSADAHHGMLHDTRWGRGRGPIQTATGSSGGGC